MPVYIAPPDPMWKFMRQPCIALGCQARLTISEDWEHFGWIVQHGPNPEHRTFISEKNPKYWRQCLVRNWLMRIHAPSVFEVEQELADVAL